MARIVPKDIGPAASTQQLGAANNQPRQASGFWAFLRTLFIGSAGLAVLAVAGTVGGSAWLTANQRAEADKAQPWANPSFTTTAVTTGGLLARWTDNDGNLENGHAYVKGIYEIWKSRSGSQWKIINSDPELQSTLPQLWQAEFNADLAKHKDQIGLRKEIEIQSLQNTLAERARKSKEAEIKMMQEFNPSEIQTEK